MPQRIRMLIGFGDFPPVSRIKITHTHPSKTASVYIVRATIYSHEIWVVIDGFLLKIRIFTTLLNWYVLLSRPVPSSFVWCVVLCEGERERERASYAHLNVYFLVLIWSTSPNTLPPVGNIIEYCECDYVTGTHKNATYYLLWTLLTLATIFFFSFWFFFLYSHVVCVYVRRLAYRPKWLTWYDYANQMKQVRKC